MLTAILMIIRFHKEVKQNQPAQKQVGNLQLVYKRRQDPSELHVRCPRLSKPRSVEEKAVHGRTGRCAVIRPSPWPLNESVGASSPTLMSMGLRVKQGGQDLVHFGHYKGHLSTESLTHLHRDVLWTGFMRRDTGQQQHFLGRGR